MRLAAPTSTLPRKRGGSALCCVGDSNPPFPGGGGGPGVGLRAHMTSLPSEVDVAVVGAGSAGIARGSYSYAKLASLKERAR